MRRFVSYAFLVFLLTLCACSRQEGKIIPRDKLARIYAEMFVADQRIGSDRQARSMADTSLVYEPIFEKYGYTSDDYRASMAHYIQDADRYAKILRETSAILNAEIRHLKEEKKKLDSIEDAQEAVEDFAPERVFFMTALENPGLFYEDSLGFYVDSAGGDMYFDAREWLDTAYYGPVMKTVCDSVEVAEPVEITEEK